MERGENTVREAVGERDVRERERKYERGKEREGVWKRRRGWEKRKR